MRIAFIGYGEAARAFRASLSAQDPSLHFAAYDILLDGEGADGACRRAMDTDKIERATSPRSAVDGAEWIFSAVTADQSFEAAQSIAPFVAPGQVVLDINSVSPQRKRDSAALFARAGAAYVDMAVMAPVHPKGHRTPVLLGGAVAPALSDRLEKLGFAFERAGEVPGDATAIKMVRSLFVKGLEAITVETLLAASASGCLDYIAASLDKSYPGLKLPELAFYQFERTLKHGKRRAAEMRESARTLDELGLTGRLADAIADVQAAMGGLADAPTGDRILAEQLPGLVARRRTPRP
jgi:3-hydroxyisobutyrate dehydrogenase-like beta-hydroxyacid dehydrogenase